MKTTAKKNNIRADGSKQLDHKRSAEPSFPDITSINSGEMNLRLTPTCPCGGGCPVCTGTVQPKLETDADRPQLSPGTHAQIQSLRGRGQPLPQSERSFFEPRFGRDFSNVRLHTDAKAAKTAGAIGAKAFTTGKDVVFGRGQYTPGTTSGNRLLAHELTHVVQQRSRRESQSDIADASNTCLQLQEDTTKTADEKAEPASEITLDIDLDKAKKSNKKRAVSLGWGARLGDVNEHWAALWAEEKFDAFALQVAGFQQEQGFKGKQIDGILGLKTWNRIRPIGEVIADWDVSWDESAYICTKAAEERLKRGYRRATGEQLVTSEERSQFNIILHSNVPDFGEIEEEYRGTGAAGALVYIGKGEFVSETDMWDNKALRPGAAIQVWSDENARDRLRAGERPLGMGTAMIFVKYDSEDPNAIWVKHYEQTQKKERSDYAIWIAANLLERPQAEEQAE